MIYCAIQAVFERIIYDLSCHKYFRVHEVLILMMLLRGLKYRWHFYLSFYWKTWLLHDFCVYMHQYMFSREFNYLMNWMNTETDLWPVPKVEKWVILLHRKWILFLKKKFNLFVFSLVCLIFHARFYKTNHRRTQFHFSHFSS